MRFIFGGTTMTDYFDFSGRKYIVTGASSGIGKAVSIALARCGAAVVLVGRSAETLNNTLFAMEGVGHIICTADLEKDRDLTFLADAAISDGKKLNGLVHCAGIATTVPIGTLSRETAEKCMSVNFFSFIELVRLLSKKKYKAQTGSIVEMSSVNSQFPCKCQTIYAASKAAANIAVKAMALELADKGFRINALLPGPVNTEMSWKARDQIGDANLEKILRRQILGMTEPENIAEIVLFLLSDMSSMITGSSLYADGGYFNFG